jgi:hypothetical protein
MFATVAIGTRFVNERTDTTVEFAQAEPEAMPTPAALDRIGPWAAAAIALAFLAYVGPVTELLQMHPYGAPGLRTW